MTPDHILGDWVVLADSQYSLRPDGTCTVALSGGRDVRHGNWRLVGADAFEIVVRHPGFPGSSHGPEGGYDEVTYYQILNHGPGRMLVEGREGGAEGLVFDAVEWHRAGFFHA